MRLMFRSNGESLSAKEAEVAALIGDSGYSVERLERDVDATDCKLTEMPRCIALCYGDHRDSDENSLSSENEDLICLRRCAATHSEPAAAECVKNKANLAGGIQDTWAHLKRQVSR